MLNRYNLPEDEPTRKRMIRQRKLLMKDVRYLATGLAGTSVLFIVALTVVQHIDTTLAVALAAFALSVPALIGAAVYVDYLPQYEPAWGLLGIGALLVCFGIGATLWHASFIVGIIFIVASITVYGLQSTRKFRRIRSDFKFGFLADYYSGGPRFFGPEYQEEVRRRAEGVQSSTPSETERS